VVIIDEGKIRAADTPANLVNSMRRAGEVTVELRCDPEVAQMALASLDDVTKVTNEKLADGWIRFSLIVAPKTDARERIAALANLHTWPLRSLRRLSATLEEVF